MSGKKRLGLVVAWLGTMGLAVGAGWALRGRQQRQSSGPAAGKETTRVEDSNHDGKPERWITELGSTTVSIGYDRNGDGRQDRVEYFDSPGKIGKIDLDENLDGRFDRYDRLTPEGQVLLIHYDADWDGLPERWVQPRADGVVATEWLDPTEDGTPDAYREFDHGGRLVHEAKDQDQDGLYEVNTFLVPRWGEGKIAEVQFDNDRDAQFERAELYSREGLRYAIQLDVDGDGRRELVRYLDPQGALVEEGKDEDSDGVYDVWTVPYRTEQRIGRDLDHDGQIDRWDAPGAPEPWCAQRCPPGR